MCFHIFMCGESMANMTLSVPDELHKEMKKMAEIKWSEVAREAFKEKIEERKMIERIVSKSKFTEKDAMEFGKMINKAATKRFFDEGNKSNKHKRNH